MSVSRKEQIFVLLTQENLTSKEIAERLNFDQAETRTYLLRLKNEKKVRVVGKKGRYHIYTAQKLISSKEQALIQELKYDLAKLYYLMKYKMIIRPELNLLPDDKEFLEKIESKIEKDEILSKMIEEENQND